MNKTELAIIEQIALLDETQQARVLELARLLAQQNQAPAAFNWSDWLDDMRELRGERTVQFGERSARAQDMLDELREESAEWPRKS